MIFDSCPACGGKRDNSMAACPHCGAVVGRSRGKVLEVPKLRVTGPDGKALFRDLELVVHEGEVVVILGGSGSGKSTLGRYLLAPEQLRDRGFQIDADGPPEAVPIGFVPQRGAPFDHLDVRGNVDLALRYAETVTGHRGDAVGWLESVSLERFAAAGTPVSELSGGQAQRLAVARTLAGGRRLLFLDEPSAGLDPALVHSLARQIRQQVETRRAACIVVTHDPALAAGVGDRLLFLNMASGKLEPLLDARWPGPFGREGSSAEERTRWQALIEEEVVRRLDGKEERTLGHRRPPIWGPAARRLVAALTRPLQTASHALLEGPAQLATRPADALRIFGKVVGQALLRPLLFYAVVSTLLGYTVLYVISSVARDLSVTAAVQFIGSSHIIALVPPIASFLFVAASGNAVNAWLGSMRLTGQLTALESLGVPRRRYLDAPAWWGLGLSALLTSAVFALGMAFGSWLFCLTSQVSEGWTILTQEFSDPRPERVPYLVRAGWSVFLYAWGIASDCVAAGTGDKTSDEDVTRAMTDSVVRSTLWVVALELLSAFVLFHVVD